MAEGATRAYTFRSTVKEQDDGRWSAWLDSIPACSTWGYTREEALSALQEAAELLVEYLIASGEEVPTDDVETIRVYA